MQRIAAGIVIEDAAASGAFHRATSGNAAAPAGPRPQVSPSGRRSPCHPGRSFLLVSLGLGRFVVGLEPVALAFQLALVVAVSAAACRYAFCPATCLFVSSRISREFWTQPSWRRHSAAGSPFCARAVGVAGGCCASAGSDRIKYTTSASDGICILEGGPV